MTFRQLTLLLIIFFLIVPMQVKKPKDISHYNEYDLKLRTTLSKVIILTNLIIIGFYIAACLLILIYRIFLVN
jgi:multisubunit Na+/H+ antiporter MnhC subunit